MLNNSRSKEEMKQVGLGLKQQSELLEIDSNSARGANPVFWDSLEQVLQRCKTIGPETLVEMAGRTRGNLLKPGTIK